MQLTYFHRGQWSEVIVGVKGTTRLCQGGGEFEYKKRDSAMGRGEACIQPTSDEMQ